jgi:hypothetical protein
MPVRTRCPPEVAPCPPEAADASHRTRQNGQSRMIATLPIREVVITEARRVRKRVLSRWPHEPSRRRSSCPRGENSPHDVDRLTLCLRVDQSQSGEGTPASAASTTAAASAISSSAAAVINRHADLPLHLEDAQALLHADAAKRLRRAAIGLVVRRLENEWNAQCCADFLQLSRDVDLQLFRLDDARPGNEEQRPVQPDLESAQVIVNYATSCARCAVFALRRALPFERRLDEGDERRWPRRRFDVNSDGTGSRNPIPSSRSFRHRSPAIRLWRARRRQDRRPGRGR